MANMLASYIDVALVTKQILIRNISKIKQLKHQDMRKSKWVRMHLVQLPGAALGIFILLVDD